MRRSQGEKPVYGALIQTCYAHLVRQGAGPLQPVRMLSRIPNPSDKVAFLPLDPDGGIAFPLDTSPTVRRLDTAKEPCPFETASELSRPTPRPDALPRRIGSRSAASALRYFGIAA